ncbi:MAG: alpha/beta hydrolase [Pseudomonadota bacterium]|nr:alpha/beta hydrolase [Pseudomonadota bacterium]
MRLLSSLALAAAVLAPAWPATSAETAPHTAAYLEVGGSKVYVETLGSGPPLLFLHGGLLYFDNNFARQRDYFAATRKVIGIDRPGHGHSPDNGRPFTYQAMADDTAAAIVKLGLGPVDIVGHSDGANIGLILAHDHPELVRRLVVSGANLRPELSPEELKRRSQWSEAQRVERVGQVEKTLPPSFRTDYQAVAPDGPTQWQKLLMKSYSLWLTPVVIEPAALKTIQAQVLVIGGDNDFTPVEGSVEIFRALPHAQLLIEPGTGHGTFTDRPALTNLAIAEFLAGP